ncbi:hypothetical protein [Pseudoduganella sp. RAF53_2]|uniref:hypothetical protein n=1 Tax=unclassified Pseudoduganella TaxID=2637179 RepID=UPI003F9E260D
MGPFRLLCLSAALLASAPVWAAEQHVSFEVRQQRIANPAPTVRVTQGDTLVLELRSDAALDVHLHGYDVPLSLKPNTPGRMKLMANTLGRFPLATHGAGHRHGPTLLYLEVVPR